MSPSRVSAASSFLLGAVLAAVAFGAAGGTELGRTSVVELLLVVAGSLALALAVLAWRDGTVYGLGAVLLFCALVGVTVVSVLWSVAPELSFVEAGRYLAYLAVFATAVAAGRLAPRGSAVVVEGILLACVAVTAYALASRVFPGSLAENELSARIGEPYGYWNAVGTTAAIPTRRRTRAGGGFREASSSTPKPAASSRTTISTSRTPNSPATSCLTASG